MIARNSDQAIQVTTFHLASSTQNLKRAFDHEKSFG